MSHNDLMTVISCTRLIKSNFIQKKTAFITSFQTYQVLISQLVICKYSWLTENDKKKILKFLQKSRLKQK